MDDQAIWAHAGAQHSRRRMNPDLGGYRSVHRRHLGGMPGTSSCCDSPQGFELHMGADSATDISKAVRAPPSVLPGFAGLRDESFWWHAGAQHSRRRRNPEIAGHNPTHHRHLGETSETPCCCDSPQGFEVHVGADSSADISNAAWALASAMPGIMTSVQPGACMASLNISSALTYPTECCWRICRISLSF